MSEPAPSMASVRQDIPSKLGLVVDRCLEKNPAERFQSGDELAKAIGELRGRELRAPPLIRAFLRNAEVSTAVILTLFIFAPSGSGEVSINLIPYILLVQLGVAARRLLRSGYSFDDIREALLAEARAQDEEAEAIRSRKWARRISGAWNRIWASKLAALENVRLGLLRVRAGVGSLDDLTYDLQRAQEIGERINAELAGRREVKELMR